MSRWRAAREEWLAWWRGLGTAGRWLPLIAAGLFVILHAGLGGLRSDHGWLAAATLAGYYAGPRVRPVFRLLLPLLLVGAVYDAQRYWAGDLRGAIRLAEPYQWELSWFGVPTPEGGMVTPAAWLQGHTQPFWDFVCGAAYLLFIPAFLATAAWWRWTRPGRAAEDVMWAMFWLNIAGYAAYLAYPAAPPWYVDRYGLGPAILTAAPEAAGAARFDALLGVDWFASYYGRSANVFGAIPSLHVGQPFLAVLFAWQFRSLRVCTTLFWLLVFFASVYLNHHYAVDGLVGMVFAAVAWAAVNAWRRRLSRG